MRTHQKAPKNEKQKNDKIAISTQLLQPTAMEIVRMTTPSAASYKDPAKTTTIPP